ncbi:hypothetical protein [Pseudonocardia spinosispora]|uniref:hypothetical protein n=1 Tax=Pseudonocardia spinosispora TaxID=103441 RepID=UPI000419747D|nr:hypothetical protein [Pseudonocardia spinosispora]
MGAPNGTHGNGAQPQHADLCADLRLVRLNGVPRTRTLEVPALLGAAAALGHQNADVPPDLAIEALLREAVGRLGESPEIDPAARTFGLRTGMKMAKAADRRRSAASAQGVSVERFRRSYEPELIDQIATEILGLLSRQHGERPGAIRRPEPVAEHKPRIQVFSGEQHVASLLRTAHANADWDLVEGVYRQCVDIATDHHGRLMPDDLPGFFAKALGRISSNYQGREQELILHGLSILGNAEHADKITPALFTQLYTDTRFDRFVQYTPGPGSSEGRRRPRPFETLVETARRYHDLNQLRGVLGDLPTSCILGGSMNYGRYFSVRGGPAATNVDVMIVIPDFSWLDEVLSAVSTLPGSARASLDALERRSRIWRERGLDDQHTVFTQRIMMWSDEPDPTMAWAPNQGEYAIDLRVASVAALDWILVADNPKLTASAAGNSRSVRDFCQQDRATDDHQRSFSGRNLRTKVEVEDVDGSLLRTLRVYSIHEERYHPGAFQNLVLPRFNKRWDDTPIGGKLETFRWKIIERLRAERRLQPYELLRVSLAHTRSEGFAPHILASIDSIDAL